MEYVSRSETEPELTVRERMIDVGNVLVTDPLFPFYVRSRAREGASFGSPAAVFGPDASLRSTAVLRSTRLLRSTRFLPASLWRTAALVRSRLRASACRTMLREMLRACLVTLAAAVLSASLFPAAILRR
jgi:hypothetical protein